MSDFPLRIEVRPLLTCGMMGTGPGSIFILLAEGMDREEAAVTLWHEIVHVLKRAGGQTEHNDDEVEALAKKLAACCPEVLALCGVEQHFKMVAMTGIEPASLTASEAGPSAIPGKTHGE